MSGAKRDFMEFVEQQEQRELREQFERNLKQSDSKGKPSPANDGNSKGNDHGLYRN